MSGEPNRYPDPLPKRLAELITDDAPRCRHCNRRLAEYLTRPWSIRCHSCRAQNRSGEPPEPPVPGP